MDDETIRLWRGVSVFDSEDRARSTATRFPKLGRFIAKLEIDEASFIFERTTGSPGHYTSGPLHRLGTPQALLARVIRVMPV